MSTYAPDPSSETPAHKPSNRKLWWIVGCGGAFVFALLMVGVLATIIVPNVWAKYAAA